LLGGPRDEAAAFSAGDCGVATGTLNRGGLLPRDSFSAEDKADVPGPGSDDFCSARPANGVCMGTGETSSSWAGVGIWPTAGVRDWTEDGTGEPNLAVDSARGTDSASELRPEPLDEEGTASGFDDSGESFAMAAIGSRLSRVVELAVRLGLFVCNVGD
jgi:hypothetical protein